MYTGVAGQGLKTKQILMAFMRWTATYTHQQKLNIELEIDFQNKRNIDRHLGNQSNSEGLRNY